MKCLDGTIMRQNFNKVYGENDMPVYVFKAAHGFNMMSFLCDKAIGTGIAPDTYMAVRYCDEEVFYIRFADSEIQYECKRNSLGEYTAKDRAKAVFGTMAAFIKNSKVKGGQIYFYSECDGFEEYCAVSAFGWGTLIGLKTTGEELFKYIYPETMNFEDNAKNIITISSAENICEAVEEGNISYYSLPFVNCRIIVAKTEAVKCNISDLKKAELIDNEKERFYRIKEALKNGKYSDFGHEIRRSSREFLSIISKKEIKLQTLFEAAADEAIICGIYERSGIYAIVEDAVTDKFIEKVGNICERKIGIRPDFYVCGFSSTEVL